MNSEKVKKLIAQNFTDPYLPTHQLGPDYVIPSDDIRTWSPNGAVKLLENESLDLPKPESVVTFFRKIVQEFPDNPALCIKRDGRWVSWTYSQYWEQVRVIAKGFIKLGLLPFHGVGILGYNSPEWLISHMAAIFGGGFGAGIYTTNSPEACYHVLNDCEANIVVVENEIQLQKILKVIDRLPHLKSIVQYSGTPNHPDVYTWDDVYQIGLSVLDTVLERRIKGLAVNQCCTLIYTSGTTGNPKGVMLSHDNMLFEVKYYNSIIKPKKGVGSAVSYLPLSHIAALGTDLFLAVCCAAVVYFAPPDALKGKLIETLVEAKPVGFLGVPRVFEKICEKIKIEELNMNFIKRYLFLWARTQAAKYHAQGKIKLVRKPFLFTLASKFVLEKIKRMLGFQRLEHIFCGGAPLSLEVQQYFLELDISVIQAYGLSECTGIHIMDDKDDITVGTVGNVSSYPPLEIKILNPDEQGCGEVLLRGRNVCMGYLKLQDKTLEILDSDRWLHSGDLAHVDKQGFLRITGRIKDIIVTSGGENIPPLIIEEAIKRFLPAVSYCMVVGDQRKYLTLLLTLKTELNMDTLLPTDELSAEAIEWCRTVGSSAEKVSEVIRNKNDKVWAAIQEAINKYNKELAISNAQKIQKWIIIPQDFSIPTGELGPTAKLKKPFILEKYAKEIDEMYN